MSDLKKKFIFLLLLPGMIAAQQISLDRSLDWSPVLKKDLDGQIVHYLNFSKASYDLNTLIPNYYELIKVENNFEYQVEITNTVYQSVDIQISGKIKDLDKIPSQIQPGILTAYQRKQAFLQLSFVPIRKMPGTGRIELLSSFTIRLTRVPAAYKSAVQEEIEYADHSVLSSGSWYKIKVNTDGIYKLSYNELRSMGISNPENVRLYGNGGGMLSLMNKDPRPDDLLENAVYHDHAAGYILFFGKSPHVWKYDERTGFFNKSVNCYSDWNYYYLRTDAGQAKTIVPAPIPEGTAGTVVSSFDDRLHHETEDINLIQSGRKWYGEHFDIITNQEFPFSVKGLEGNEPVRMKISVVARASASTYFQISSGQNSLGNISVPGTDLTNTYTASYGYQSTDTFRFYSTGESFNVRLNYIKNSASAQGWLDYISINARRKLEMHTDQLLFRDSRSAGKHAVSTFRISGANENTLVWDVTSPENIQEIQGTLSGGILSFNSVTETIHEYIAFNRNSQFLSAVTQGEGLGKIPNQDLHSLRSKNYVVISHPDFLLQARQMAAHRKDHDGLDTIVVTPDQIYNEFSSGSPDVAAIRDFIKMLYDRAGTEDEMPKYVLLFGDGSFDNKTQSAENTNYILTYQSEESLSPTASYVTDDFFGLLDANEGGSSGLVDVGIGRFPVSSVNQAANVVNKTISYDMPDKMSDWRNILCMIGDDEDYNTHVSQADDLARTVEGKYPLFNIQKIYLDAYTQTITASGQRYPDVNEALNQRVNKGALIINYTGHGGASGLAHERILGLNDIVTWENADRLPLFLTATCEFSRFDEYEITSAGELVLLNPDGGGIALLTTTRLVYSGPNHALNERFYEYVFEKDSKGRNYRLGDVIRLTKNSTSASINKRNFTLLGDPAVQLAYPKYQVRVSSINETDINKGVDTLKALGKVKVTGEVVDLQGNLLNDFQGLIYPTVFDKSTNMKTLANDPDYSSPFTFNVRNRILYKGKATVSEGKFSFSFVVPKDIAYNYDYGKISFYAAGLSEDAGGSFLGAIIGGTADSIGNDTEGPEILIYMNDENFVFGGTTDHNPELLIFVNDSNGINTIGSGIGHDITASFQEESVKKSSLNQTIVLNDYYEADTDSYKSGKIRYPLRDLPEGKHILKIKVWDVHNNSSEEFTEFIVANSEELVLQHVLNYPNPFTTHTSFFFEHNHANSQLDVLIQVFTVSGKLVKTIERQITSTGFRSDPIDWDGLDDYGSQIGRGVYIYRIKVRSSLGQTAEKYEKLVILK